MWSKHGLQCAGPRRVSRPPSPPANSTSVASLRERLLVATRREAEARYEAEMRAVDAAELRSQVAHWQQQAEEEKALREDFEQRLAVRHLFMLYGRLRCGRIGKAKKRTVWRHSVLQVCSAEASNLRQDLEVARFEASHDTRAVLAQKRADQAQEEAQRANLQCQSLLHQLEQLRSQLVEERSLRRTMQCRSGALTVHPSARQGMPPARGGTWHSGGVFSPPIIYVMLACPCSFGKWYPMFSKSL